MIYEGDDGATVVKFSHGTVAVISGTLPEAPQIRAIELMQAPEPHPIGDEIPGLERFTDKCRTDELGYEGYVPGVRLLFDNPKSVDVLLEILFEIKNQLEEMI